MPQNQPQQGAQHTQYRVARIVENTHDDLVFDLTATGDMSGSVRVVHSHIGDDDDCIGDSGMMSGVRAIIEEVEEDSALDTILLDSGADASVFPVMP